MCVFNDDSESINEVFELQGKITRSINCTLFLNASLTDYILFVCIYIFVETFTQRVKHVCALS